MSDANRVKVGYNKEVTWATTPAAALKTVRLVSESLRQEQQITQSNELRSDRQVSSFKRLGLNAAGDIAFEISYGAHDDFLQGALQSADWGATAPAETAGITQTDISSASSDNSISRVAGSWVSDGFRLFGWVRISGFTSGGPNGIAKISAITAAKLTLTHITVVTDAAGESVTVKQLSEITNGTTFQSFSIEREYQDLTTTLAAFRGMSIDNFSLSIVAAQLITGGFGFLGKNETSETATIGTGGDVEAPTNDVLNAVDDVFAVLEAGAATQITQCAFAVANNLRQRLAVSNLGPISLGSGTIGVTGTLQAYFSTATLFDKFLNQTDTTLAINTKDAAGNQYVFDFPRVRLTSGQRVAGGINTDIIADFGFGAFMHATELKTLRIGRIAA